MKKGFVVFLFLIAISFPVFADNSVRIAELKKQQEAIGQRVQQAQAVIEQGKQQLLLLQGAIVELESQDKVTEKPGNPAEKKAEEKK